jgi:hypothetical protein
LTCLQLVHTEEIITLLRASIDSLRLPLRIQVLAVAAGAVTGTRFGEPMAHVAKSS